MQGHGEVRPVVGELGPPEQLIGHVIFHAVDALAEVLSKAQAPERAQQTVVASRLLEAQVVERDRLGKAAWGCDREVAGMDLDADRSPSVLIGAVSDRVGDGFADHPGRDLGHLDALDADDGVDQPQLLDDGVGGLLHLSVGRTGDLPCPVGVGVVGGVAADVDVGAFTDGSWIAQQ
jgi:hypothetical protein